MVIFGVYRCKMQDVAIHCMKKCIHNCFYQRCRVSVMYSLAIYNIHTFVYLFSFSFIHSHLFTSQLMHGTLNKLDKQTIDL